MVMINKSGLKFVITDNLGGYQVGRAVDKLWEYEHLRCKDCHWYESRGKCIHHNLSDVDEYDFCNKFEEKI